MKTAYSVDRDSLSPPVGHREVTLFTCSLQSTVLRDWLTGQGIDLPREFELVHNSGSDDPPDLEALGLGWECTEFPPNQSAIDKVHGETRGGIVVPAFSETGGDIRKIRDRSIPFNGYPRLTTVNDEIAALKQVFLDKVIGGTKSKDVPENDVLLLDRRDEPSGDLIATAVHGALKERPPQNIRLVLLVGWKRFEVGDEGPIPEVLKMYPEN